MKNAEKVTQAQITNEVCAFLVKMCRHMNENSQLSHLFAKYSKSLSPIYMAESTERAEVYFEKLLPLLVAKRNFKSCVADSAKLEYSFHVNVIVTENKEMNSCCFKRILISWRHFFGNLLEVLASS